MINVAAMNVMANEWSFRVFKQAYHKDYKDYCAIAERREGNKRFIVNAEGDTPELALEKVKRRVSKPITSSRSKRRRKLRR